MKQKNEQIGNCLFWILFGILIIVRIWIITGIPKFFINGAHDDLYYAKMAHYLMHGEWMGPYDQYTLIKGPFYGFFLVASFFTGLPLFLNETLFYVIACILLFIAVKPLIPGKWWRILLLAIILYLPASMTTGFNLRVYREFVYFSLTLYVVAFSLGLFLRTDQKLNVLFFWGSGLGLSMGAFLLTREEGVWIFPMLVILLMGCVYKIWKRKVNHKWVRSVLILSIVILMLIPTWIVSGINQAYYGFWGVSEQLDKDFNQVINTLGRIKTSQWYPYSPIIKESVALASDVSPIMAELEPALMHGMDLWQVHADAMIAYQSPWVRDRYFVDGAGLGNLFIWMFRDILANQGYYADGIFPRERLQALAEELGNACDRGVLNCYPPVEIPLVTSLRSEHLPIIFHIWVEDVMGLMKLSTDVNGLTGGNVGAFYPYEPVFAYFEQISYNPIQSEILGAGSDPMVDDTYRDIRIDTLAIKYRIMQFILKIYTSLTLPLTIIILVGWLMDLIYRLVKRKQSRNFQVMFVILFLGGLLTSRTLVLAIVTATSTVIGRFYGASNFIFLFILLFFLLYSLVMQIFPKKLQHDKSRITGQSIVESDLEECRKEVYQNAE